MRRPAAPRPADRAATTLPCPIPRDRVARPGSANLAFPPTFARSLTRPAATRSRPPTRLAFHLSRIVIDVGVLLVLGAMSLPFVSAEGWGQRAVAADALPALLLVLPIFVITLLPDHSQPVPAPLGWIALFLAATALPYAVIKHIDASTLAATVEGSVGLGARLLVLGTCVTLVGLVIGLVRGLLGLPVTGTYPARQDGAAARAGTTRRATTSSHQPARPSSTTGTAAATPAGSDPAPAATAPPASPPPAAVPPRPAAPPPQSGHRVPRPAPADPDTEPTLPGVKRTRPWWPDDLEDLFS